MIVLLERLGEMGGHYGCYNIVVARTLVLYQVL